MGTVILNVVIVLGIIIAGGFLIFFLGDLLMSIVNPRGEEERVKLKRKESAKRFTKKVEALPYDQQAEIKEETPVAGAIIEEVHADEEVKEEAAEAAPVVEEYKAEEEDAEPTEEEKLAEARAALERRKAEILKRMQEQIESDDEDEEEAEAEEEPAEEAEEDVEEEVEETVEVDEEKEQMRAELEEAKKELEAERARYEELAAKMNSAEAEATVVTGSKEDYEAQKVELEARLRDNEKELKACKKEYIPLAKVNKTLANDEKKLRRKEAIVAKQKVMLYGVNNYEDIDEEKAKKLAEELDLLDGLKLSVQHCHEVMDANKDRFPVLEKMYYILKTQNEHIKADLLEVNNALAALANTDNNDSQE